VHAADRNQHKATSDHEDAAVARFDVLRRIDLRVGAVRRRYGRALETDDLAWQRALAEERSRLRCLKTLLRAEVAGDDAQAERLARVIAVWQRAA
jgi:hypothetical protein